MKNIKLCPLTFPVGGTDELVNNWIIVVLDKEAFILPLVLPSLPSKIILGKKKEL